MLGVTIFEADGLVPYNNFVNYVVNQLKNYPAVININPKYVNKFNTMLVNGLHCYKVLIIY